MKFKARQRKFAAGLKSIPRRNLQASGEAIICTERKHPVIPAATWREELLAMTGFETPETARDEDQERLKRARWLAPTESDAVPVNLGPKLQLSRYQRPLASDPGIDPDELLPLMERWHVGVEGATPSVSLASSLSMRGTRLRVIPELLAAFSEFDDDDLAIVTVVKPAWALTPKLLLATSATTIKKQFIADLKRIGVAAHPDPMVGFLDGEFEPTSELFFLHFQLVTTKAKALLLKKSLSGLKRAYKPTSLVKRPIKVPKLKNRVVQLSYLVKAFWPEKAVRSTERGDKRDRKYHRIKEPASTVYLLWLNRHQLSDIAVMNGGWSWRKGGSPTMRSFYLSIFGSRNSGRRKRSSKVVKP